MTSPITSTLTRPLTYSLTKPLGTILGQGGGAVVPFAQKLDPIIYTGEALTLRNSSNFGTLSGVADSSVISFIYVGTARFIGNGTSQEIARSINDRFRIVATATVAGVANVFEVVGSNGTNGHALTSSQPWQCSNVNPSVLQDDPPTVWFGYLDTSVNPAQSCLYRNFVQDTGANVTVFVGSDVVHTIDFTESDVYEGGATTGTNISNPATLGNSLLWIDNTKVDFTDPVVLARIGDAVNGIKDLGTNGNLVRNDGVGPLIYQRHLRGEAVSEWFKNRGRLTDPAGWVNRTQLSTVIAAPWTAKSGIITKVSKAQHVWADSFGNGTASTATYRAFRRILAQEFGRSDWNFGVGGQPMRDLGSPYGSIEDRCSRWHAGESIDYGTLVTAGFSADSGGVAGGARNNMHQGYMERRPGGFTNNYFDDVVFMVLSAYNDSHASPYLGNASADFTVVAAAARRIYNKIMASAPAGVAKGFVIGPWNGGQASPTNEAASYQSYEEEYGGAVNGVQYRVLMGIINALANEFGSNLFLDAHKFAVGAMDDDGTIHTGTGSVLIGGSTVTDYLCRDETLMADGYARGFLGQLKLASFDVTTFGDSVQGAFDGRDSYDLAHDVVPISGRSTTNIVGIPASPWQKFGIHPNDPGSWGYSRMTARWRRAKGFQ